MYRPGPPCSEIKKQLPDPVYSVACSRNPLSALRAANLWRSYRFDKYPLVCQLKSYLGPIYPRSSDLDFVRSNSLRQMVRFQAYLAMLGGGKGKDILPGGS